LVVAVVVTGPPKTCCEPKPSRLVSDWFWPWSAAKLSGQGASEAGRSTEYSESVWSVWVV
jgi:hypothetical protein